MPIQSPYPNIYLPEGDILSVLCSDKSISDEPLWIDATTPSKALSKAGALKWIKRLGLGLRKRDITVGDAVVVMSPNHIFIPIGYFGIISSGAMFSGVSPAFTTRGKPIFSSVSSLYPFSKTLCVLTDHVCPFSKKSHTSY